MYRISQYILLLLPLAIVACKEDPDFSNDQWETFRAYKLGVEVSTSDLHLSGDASQGTFQVKAMCPWSVDIEYDYRSSSWLELSSKSGKKDADIMVRAEANPSMTSPREASIIVSDGMNTCVIIVSQEAGTEWIKLSKNELHFPYPGGTAYVTVYSNVQCYSEATPNWCEISANSNGSQMVVKIAENETYEQRSTTIRVTGNVAEATVDVTQDAAPEPVVGNLAITDITKTSASYSFTFSSAALQVSRAGICYSSSNKQPTANDYYYDTYAYSKSGSVEQTVSNLQLNTTYYARPYVVTTAGTTYGSVVSFTTKKNNSPNEDDNPTPGY